PANGRTTAAVARRLAGRSAPVAAGVAVEGRTVHGVAVVAPLAGAFDAVAAYRRDAVALDAVVARPARSTRRLRQLRRAGVLLSVARAGVDAGIVGVTVPRLVRGDTGEGALGLAAVAAELVAVVAFLAG